MKEKEEERRGVKHLREINKARAHLNMPLVKTKLRQCMVCIREFISHGYNHRLCGCKKE